MNNKTLEQQLREYPVPFMAEGVHSVPEQEKFDRSMLILETPYGDIAVSAYDCGVNNTYFSRSDIKDIAEGIPVEFLGLNEERLRAEIFEEFGPINDLDLHLLTEERNETFYNNLNSNVTLEKGVSYVVKNVIERGVDR